MNFIQQTVRARELFIDHLLLLLLLFQLIYPIPVYQLIFAHDKWWSDSVTDSGMMILVTTAMRW